MSIERTIVCDVCGARETEAQPEEGWKGWGAVQGVQRNGVVTPSLCPACLQEVMEFLEGKQHGMD